MGAHGGCGVAWARRCEYRQEEEEEEEEVVAASAASGTTKALISVFVGVPLGVLLGVVGSQMFLDRRRKKYAGPFGEDVPNVSGHDDEKVVKRICGLMRRRIKKRTCSLMKKRMRTL